MWRLETCLKSRDYWLSTIWIIRISQPCGSARRLALRSQLVVRQAHIYLIQLTSKEWIMAIGLAMAESERYLPLLVDKVEAICEESGLRHDSIVMRMTGCPNGCARPYVAGTFLTHYAWSQNSQLSFCRDRIRRQSSGNIPDVAWRWILWSTSQQDLQRSV